MYDTIILESPLLSPEILPNIKDFCEQSERVDLSTGEILYTFTSGQLDGSFDYRVSVQLRDYTWVKFGSAVPVKVPCDPYIRVECSIHKLLMGHNVWGGPTDLIACAGYLVHFLEEVFNVPLPDFMGWELVQIDVSKIYVFSSEKDCFSLLNGLKLGYYSRRKPQVYDTSIMYAGKTSTLKFYHKGSEFKKHDCKRVIKYCRKQIDLIHRKTSDYPLQQAKYQAIIDKYVLLQKVANKIVRFECSIKTRKIKELFGNVEKVLVSALNDNVLKDYAESELNKLVGGGNAMLKKSGDVLFTLQKAYNNGLCNVLYGLYCRIVQFGYDSVKNSTPDSTFRRNIKYLKDAGITWSGANIDLNTDAVEPSLPADFSFFNPKYINDSVSDEVKEKLYSFK